MNKFWIAAPLLLTLGLNAYAGSAEAVLKTTAMDQELGTVHFKDSPYGLLIQPNLKDLPPGIHGFHLHAKADCANKGLAAGGHFDPQHTNSHEGPYGKGHLGDLPVLYVDSSGVANIPQLAPRLKVKDLQGLSLIVHEGQDNYSNEPPLGGGGQRIACGLLKIK